MIARKEEEGWLDRLLAMAARLADREGEAVLVLKKDQATGDGEPTERMACLCAVSQATEWQRANAWKRVEPAGK